MNSLLKKIRTLRKRISTKIRNAKHAKFIHRHVEYMRRIGVNMYKDNLKSGERYLNPKILSKYGKKLYSQNEEDGIILEIFNRIGTTNKIFVEFGIGDGLENNTLALLFQGWKGLWLEGSASSVNSINDHFKSVLDTKQLQITEAFITKDNINELISSKIKEKEIDLLSVDIDGNDVHIFNEISVINPRVVIIEYNAKFFPPIMFTVDYNPTHMWQGDDYMGVSLKYLEVDFAKKGYKLVGCDIAGVNAFFVREDLVGDKFLTPYTAEEHYEPVRYHLLATNPSPTYQAIDKILTSCVKNNR